MENTLAAIDTGERLISIIKSYDAKADIAMVQKAIDFAIHHHADQKRASGEPYFTHPIEVAELLTTMKLDDSSIITALLHDTVEDTEATLEEVEEKFGAEIRNLVDGVTKLGKLEFQSEHLRNVENYRKLLLAISEDIRVLLVKLADRLHNMRTLQHIKKPEKRQRIARETMDIYAPLAERIGMQRIKDELQDIAFKELHTDGYESIVTRLQFLRDNGAEKLMRITKELEKVFKDAGVNATLQGREKSPYSIWRKMQQKNVNFEQLSDIVAFRALVDDLGDCYRVLGAVHANFHMVPGSFKDFISTPKENGYQSIHTVVIGPEQQRIEIQIRTRKMHEVAEMGVAAHWSYKQGREYNTDGRQFRWIRELLTVIENAASPEEFMQNTKLEMYHDQVFCFTPKGDLIALPRGATPVDFAFAVHSNVGLSCVGAKVAGKIVPLRTQLKNGDQVEIIRSKSHQPSPVWENFVVTAKAKAEIRRFIRTQQRNEYVNLGKAILSKLFQEHKETLKDSLLEPHLKALQKKTVEDIYAAVGEGILPRSDITKIVFPGHITRKRTLLDRIRRRVEDDPEADRLSVPINGLIPGMAIHFAGCCYPLPGEKIIGIVNSGKGVTIHTSDCEQLEKLSESPERFIDVSWQDQAGNDKLYVGRIKAVLTHEKGSLGTLANTLAKAEANISNLRIVGRAMDFFELILDVEARDVEHLSSIMALLRSQPNIRSVERYGSKN